MTIAAAKTEDLVSEVTIALRQKTAARKIAWKPTVEENAFIWASDAYGVSIERKLDYRNAVKGFELRFVKDGVEVESVAADIPGTPEYENLRDLFVLARRSAHNVEESLGKMLQDLERI